MAAKVSIRWTCDPLLSAVHAAHVVATGAACTDRKTEQALVEPVTEINVRLLSASIDVARFWQRLLDETVADSSNSLACEIALAAAGCSELQLEQIASVIRNRLSDCRSSFNNRFPKLKEQLELRGQPIRQQWAAVGPGLLAHIAKQIWNNDPPHDWWPTRIDAAIVQPMLGGDGDYALDSTKFWIEAVLTDVDPAVPEVLRVAWLITQLAVEMHTQERSGDTSTSGHSIPWSIGSVPLVLSAGVELEVIKTAHELPIASALSLWRLGDDQIATIVTQWWTQWQAEPTPIPVGLKLLDQTLRAARRTSSTKPDTGIDLSEFDDH